MVMTRVLVYPWLQKAHAISEDFDQIARMRRLIWILIGLTCQIVSEKKIFKYYTILYVYTAQGLGQITAGGEWGGEGCKSLILTKKLCRHNHTL